MVFPILTYFRSSISPHEIVTGLKPSLPGDLDLIDISSQGLKVDQLSYVQALKQKLSQLHEGVLINNEIVKAKDKTAYDRRFNVKEPPFKVGDIILLHDARVQSHSSTV